MRSARARSLLLGVVVTLGGFTAVHAGQGDLDPAFGVDGIMGPSYNEHVEAAATLLDGNVAVVGSLKLPDPGVAWLWVDQDGHVTESCGLATPFLAGFEGKAVLASRRGNLVVGGMATIVGSESHQRAMIASYAASSPCDTLDSSWSANGWQLLNPDGLCDTGDCAVVGISESLAEFPRLFALVEAKVNLLVSRYFVVAFFTDGTVNTGFGTDGYAEVTATGLGTLARGGARLAIDPQGRPLVLATRYDPFYSLDADVALVRLTSGGVLDSSFEGDGVSVVLGDSDKDELAGPLTVAADGTIYLGARDITTPTGWLVARSPEGTWGKDDLQSDIDIASIVAEGDSRLLFLHNDPGTDTFVVSRWKLYTGLGGGHFWTFDGFWGTSHGDASYDIDFGGSNSQTAISMVLSGGRPIVLGSAATDSSSALFAIRALSNYIDADGFESGSTAFWSGKR